MFERLKDKAKNLGRGSRSIASITAELFPIIDTEKIKQDLKIVKSAQEDGKANFPSPDSRQISSTEIEIESRIKRHQKYYLDECQNRLANYYERYANEAQFVKLELVRNKEKSLVTNVIDEAKAIADSLYSFEQRLKNTARELLNFRKKHLLMDRLPKIHNKWNAWFILLGTIILEIIITQVLAREASASFITVLIIAIIYSCINCMVPFYFSESVKWVNYQIPSFNTRKYIGILVLLMLVGLSLFLNLGMGHYREAAMEITAVIANIGQNASDEQLLVLMGRQAEILSQVMARMAENPFGLNDFASWMLFILGFALSAIALIDGIRRKDPYPGYGDQAIAYEHAEEEYNAQIDEFNETLIDMREQGVADINEYKAEIKSSLQSIPTIINGCQDLLDAYKNALDTITTDYETLIMLYRQENLKARENSAPEYFQEKPSIQFVIPEIRTLETPKGIDENEIFEQVDSFASTLHHELEKISNDKNKKIQDVLEQYPLDVAAYV